MPSKEKGLALATSPGGTWVQTERAAHEQWARLAVSNPRASSVLHVMVAKMGRHNALIVSLPNLARLCGCSRNTVIRALDVLKKENWIESRQIGANGTTNAYIINSRVAWTGKREGIRFSEFDAKVIVSDDEQPDRDTLDAQAPLIALPQLYPGERQLPAGDGLPPPSQPSFMGFEPDLPATKRD